MITRRSFIGQTSSLLGGAFAASFASPSFAAKSQPPLMMYGPPVGPSVTLAYLARHGLLREAAGGDVGFDTYMSPDILRANFITGDWQLAVSPSYVAANLSNKGLPIKMLNIMSWGMLYLISYDKALTSIEGLAGQTIGMFFRNDMPDLVFRRVLKEKGLKVGKDYQLRYVGTPFEALQLLLSGRIQHCVLPEPAATAGLVKAKKLGKRLYRSLDLAQDWASVTGGKGRFPMAGAMVHEDLIRNQPGFVDAFHQACVTGTEWVNNNPAAAADIAVETMPLPASVIEQSIPATHLTSVRAGALRQELEEFYSLLAEDNPAIIGGKLPDASFYL